eukprot:SAG11_NODE_2886_length_2867_cov_1.874277_5_plen_44_part_00
MCDRIFGSTKLTGVENAVVSVGSVNRATSRCIRTQQHASQLAL